MVHGVWNSTMVEQKTGGAEQGNGSEDSVHYHGGTQAKPYHFR